MKANSDTEPKAEIVQHELLRAKRWRCGFLLPTRGDATSAGYGALLFWLDNRFGATWKVPSGVEGEQKAARQTAPAIGESSLSLPAAATISGEGVSPAANAAANGSPPGSAAATA